MGHPMVPKITIAVRSNAAQGPRRVSLPSSAAAGGVPFPAVGAPALRQRSPFAGRPLDTPELLLWHPARDRAPRRERFRYAGLLPGRAAWSFKLRAAAAPAGVRGAGPTKVVTAPVHGSGASPGRAARAAWIVGRGSPGNGSREPFERRAPYAGHHGVTTGFCLAPRAATGLEADFAPRHYRNSRGASSALTPSVSRRSAPRRTGSDGRSGPPAG